MARMDKTNEGNIPREENFAFALYLTHLFIYRRRTCFLSAERVVGNDFTVESRCFESRRNNNVLRVHLSALLLMSTLRDR